MPSDKYGNWSQEMLKVLVPQNGSSGNSVCLYLRELLCRLPDHQECFELGGRFKVLLEKAGYRTVLEQRANLTQPFQACSLLGYP